LFKNKINGKNNFSHKKNGNFAEPNIITMNIKTLLSCSFLSIFLLSLKAQDIPVKPSVVGTGTYWGISKPLRDLPVMTQKDFRKMARKGRHNELNEGLGHRSYPYAATALPKGPDPAWQNFMGPVKGSKAPIVNFDGATSPYYPPDCNGTAGPNHYMQTINTVYTIYDKTGTLVAGPTNINLLFGSVPGANRNDGDPIILYDEQADRWLVTEFSIPASGTNYMLMAVSTTNDPTGTWHQYSFPVDAMPDYPKFSVWRDGYYMGDNNGGGHDIYVFERSQMLTGGTAQQVGFHNPFRPQSVDGFMCVPPVDNDGVFAPTGTPGMFIAFNDDAIGGGTDQLWLYELSVDWTNPTASTFNRTQQLDVQPFSADFGPNWNNITQKGTSQKVDGIPQVIMNVPQYRNFGGYQTIVCCHTVNVDGNGHAGVRWYELRKTTGSWVVRQQGTYAPDNHNRWMGSIMLNGSNTLALGYSISSSSLYPGIRYCGQTPSAFANGSGVLDIAEDTIQAGANSQTGINRWGDYSLMCVDPADDQTFWFTDQYIGSGGSRKTKIASFKFITPPNVTTIAATGVGSTSATLNAKIKSQGIPTDYYFRYSTDPFNLSDSTAILPAGSDTAFVNVSTDVSGLQSNKKYYFRAYGSNAAGLASGATLNFTTGAAPALAVNPPNQAVTNPAGSTMFIVTSNIDWSVSSDASWCTVTPAGTGNDTIIAQFTENTVASQRVANITVSGPGVASQTVTVTQDGPAAALSVFPGNRDVPTSSGNTYFNVTSNTTWSVVSDASWCIVTNAGTGNDTIKAGYSENTVIGSRVANITVSAPGVASVTVTVTQDGIAATLSVTPPNRDVTATAGNTTFDVTSNTSWSVSSDVAWCTITPSGTGNDVIQAQFAENVTLHPRIATITVSAPGAGSQSVTVTQAGAAPMLSVAPQNQNVAALPGTTPFEVTSNADWTAVSDATWCTVTPSGTGNGTIVADYTANTTDQARTASIQVTVASLPVQTVTVSQAKSAIAVEEHKGNDFQIYPNPTKGVFKIVPATGDNGKIEIRVQDAGGRTIYSREYRDGTEYEIDLSSASSGTYHIILKTENNLTVRKLVVIK
jgi:hypothetical protein